MRTVLAISLLALAAVAAVPSADAYLTTPKEICHPGEWGVCHWSTGPDQCAMAHAGTMWAGACTTTGEEEPARVCTTVVTALWDGWCPQDGNNLGDLFP